VLNKKTGRIENIHFATRWNPKKDHHFFFAKGFPDKYKKIYNHPETGVFAKTNSSLAAAGVKARFYIHNNDGVDGKEKKFGDIRYSFINYITESSPSAPLGYGPSDSNPFTGEIISANSMVWTSSLKYYVKRLRDVDANQDATGEASLFKKMRRFLGYEATEWVVPMSFEKDMAGDVFHHVMKDNTYGVPFWNSFTSVDPQVHSFFNARDPKTFVHSLSDRARGEAINFTDYNVGMTDAIKHNEDVMHEVHQQRNGHCIYPVVEALGGVHDAITVGVDDQTIIDSILYRVAIHEFGHNLSLRHNFYGSVDKKNFAGAKSNSSSVMDYLDLEDEVAADRDWESYDKAALQYLYSNGKVDSPKFHMYCTDEHRPLNAMCSTWDTGTTPTEIIANMISDYEKLYFILNYRYDRAYWNTGYYAGRVFGIMWDIKKFLMMWRQDFTADKLNEYFKNRDDLTTEQKKDLAQEIQDQFHKSVEVSVAFFDSVVQQAASDRPWRSEFDSWSGAVTRLGIIYDKLFAVRFLLGDEGFMYNPSQSFNNISYLSYIDIPEVRQPIEKAFENALTTRVDMDTWFLGYSRELFSFNAMNPSNRSDTSLVERIKVVKLSAEQLKDDLKLDTSTLADIGTFTVNTVDTEFKVGATVGYVKIHGNYYLVEKYNSPYSYNIFQKIQERLGDSNINTLKGDLVDLYNMYQRVTR
ncbi:MAG: hypothetical protein HN730_05825, partial [Bdellovibrionales bacterium]|nr:hypothetical protein [Bdellovibrionales bacterium]